MKGKIDAILEYRGYGGNFIFPLVLSREEWKAFPPLYKSLPAFSIGGLIPNIEILNMPKTPIGIIGMEKEISSNFNSKEIDFILSHEIGHILGNHTFLTIFKETGSTFVNDFVSSIFDDTKVKNLLLGAFNIIKIFIDFEFTKSCEIEADLIASEISGKRVATQTIKKLANLYADGDLTKPSHFTQNGLPIITFEERIEALESIPRFE